MYAGINCDSGELVAVKVIKRPQSVDLTCEVDILRRLAHPNIVKYFGCMYDEDAKSLLIAMEYVSGGSLMSLIRCSRARGEMQLVVTILLI